MSSSGMTDTLIERMARAIEARPSIQQAARSLSRQIVGLVTVDWQKRCLLVSHVRADPPKNWRGYPVERKRPAPLRRADPDAGGTER